MNHFEDTNPDNFEDTQPIDFNKPIDPGYKDDVWSDIVRVWTIIHIVFVCYVVFG